MTATTWAARVQESTKVTADSHRELWSQEDLELVAAFTEEESDEELAKTLGRSLYALWAIQHRMRTEGVEAVLGERARRDAKRVVATCPTHHIALTALGDCDWC